MKMDRDGQIHNRGMWSNREKCVKKWQRRKTELCIIRDLILAPNTQLRAQGSESVPNFSGDLHGLPPATSGGQMRIVQNLSVQNLPACCGVIPRPALVLRVATVYVVLHAGAFVSLTAAGCVWPQDNVREFVRQHPVMIIGCIYSSRWGPNNWAGWLDIIPSHRAELLHAYHWC